MSDMTPAAEQVWLTAVRQVNPTERLREALDFSESVRVLALSRLRATHPGRPDVELVETLREGGAESVPPDRVSDGS